MNYKTARNNKQPTPEDPMNDSRMIAGLSVRLLQECNDIVAILDQQGDLGRKPVLGALP